MIQLTNAGKRFGYKLLFDSADWQINPRDRVGLVGANGTGKTTLLRILAGAETLDYGPCAGMKTISAGYLPQDGLALSGDTVFAECMKVFNDLREMEQEMESLSHSLADLDPTGPDYAQASDRLHQLQGEFRLRDGYALEAKAGAVLGGLGFSKKDWLRRTDEFSGGWQNAHRTRQAPPPATQPLTTLRTHQPPRPRSPQLARRLPPQLPPRLRPHLPRPLFLRRHRRPNRRNMEQAPLLLHWQLRQVSRPESPALRATTRRRQKSARPHRATRNLHQPLPLPGHQSQTSPKPHQRARKNRAHRTPPGRKNHPLHLPPTQTQRPRSSRAGQRRQKLRPETGASRGRPGNRTRRPRSPRRRQRRR